MQPSKIMPARHLLALIVALAGACDADDDRPTRFTVVEGRRELPPEARRYLDEHQVPQADQEAIDQALREPVTAPPELSDAGDDPSMEGAPYAEIPAHQRDLLLCGALKVGAVASVQWGSCWSMRRGRRIEVYVGGLALGASASVLGILYRDDERAAAQHYAGLGVGAAIPPFFPIGGQAGFFHGPAGRAYLGGLTAGIDLTASPQFLGIIDPAVPGAPTDGFEWFLQQTFTDE